MTLRETLLTNPSFEFHDNVFYQRNIVIDDSFERYYLSLREKEGRLYSDDEVRLLPNYSGKKDLTSEWKIRKHSAMRLISHLENKGRNKLLLEVGCGNGWLTNLVSASLVAQVVGLDLNKTELIQGSKVFRQNQSIAFIYGNIFSLGFPGELFDAIILASTIQYFGDLNQLISHLFNFIKPNGEIHILDSPIYETEKEQEQAKIRTRNYFERIGQDPTNFVYHHHGWASLRGFKLRFLLDPRTLSSRLSRKFTSGVSPFPHIVIHKSS